MVSEVPDLVWLMIAAGVGVAAARGFIVFRNRVGFGFLKRPLCWITGHDWEENARMIGSDDQIHPVAVLLAVHKGISPADVSRCVDTDETPDSPILSVSRGFLVP